MSVGGVPTNYSYTVTVIDPARTVPVFTDNPLAARATPVKAVHVVELRQAIDTLRSGRGLTAYPWTDGTLTARTTAVRAAHVAELRAALDDVYRKAGKPVPVYTTRNLQPGATAIAAVDIAELRAAVLGILVSRGDACRRSK